MLWKHENLMVSHFVLIMTKEKALLQKIKIYVYTYTYICLLIPFCKVLGSGRGSVPFRKVEDHDRWWHWQSARPHAAEQCCTLLTAVWSAAHSIASLHLCNMLFILLKHIVRNFSGLKIVILMKFVIRAACISSECISCTTEHIVYFLIELQNVWLSVNTSLKKNAELTVCLRRPQPASRSALSVHNTQSF